MLSVGSLCQDCNPCDAKVGGYCGVSILCPECNGHALFDESDRCKHCTDGKFDLTGCPGMYVSGYGVLCSLSNAYEFGILPDSGGYMDQAAWFIHALEYLTFEKNKAVKKERPDVGKGRIQA